MSLKTTFERELANLINRFVSNHANADKDEIERWTVECIQKRQGR